MKEVWKAVVGWEGEYDVSNKGRIRYFMSGPRGMSGKQVAITKNHRGHLQATLYRTVPVMHLRYKGRKHVTIHQVVGAAFIGPLPSGWHIHHRDGCATNNCVDNLEYLTPKDHRARHTNARVGSLTPADVRAIRRLRDSGVTLVVLANKYHVRSRTIENALRRIAK
jgi:hypothetical protein